MVDTPLINVIGQSKARSPGERAGVLAAGDPVEVIADTYAHCRFGTAATVAGVRPPYRGQGELYELREYPGLLFWREELSRKAQP